MTDCRYCKKDLELAEYRGFAHIMCLDVFFDRQRNGICQRCNSRPASTHGNCAECGETGEFVGYPGP